MNCKKHEFNYIDWMGINYINGYLLCKKCAFIVYDFSISDKKVVDLKAKYVTN